MHPLYLMCTLPGVHGVAARVVRYGNPNMAREVVRAIDTKTPPQLPAYIMRVNDRPCAALFFDSIGGQMNAVCLVSNSDVMCRTGYMSVFRRLIDRSCTMY